MDTRLESISCNKSFGGWNKRFRHYSPTLNCDMTFALYLPPQAEKQRVPLLYWLSGLSCTEENFIHKAGGQRIAAELGMAIVVPDTSPRGENVPDDPEGLYDFGHGAGFYVNATQSPWQKNYQMYEYVTRELPQLIESNLPILAGIKSISGHSMGGHGALICALKNPESYTNNGCIIPRGVLLHGPPGTGEWIKGRTCLLGSIINHAHITWLFIPRLSCVAGKTLLAKAVAGELICFMHSY